MHAQVGKPLPYINPLPPRSRHAKIISFSLVIGCPEWQTKDIPCLGSAVKPLIYFLRNLRGQCRRTRRRLVKEAGHSMRGHSSSPEAQVGRVTVTQIWQEVSTDEPQSSNWFDRLVSGVEDGISLVQ